MATIWQSIEGTEVLVDGSHPLVVKDPDAIWLIRSGKIDAFWTALENDVPVSRLHHFIRLEEGSGVVGIPAEVGTDNPLFLYLKGSPGTTLVQYTFSQILMLGTSETHRETVGNLFSQWIKNAISGISRDRIRMELTEAYGHLTEPDAVLQSIKEEAFSSSLTAFHNALLKGVLYEKKKKLKEEKNRFEKRKQANISAVRQGILKFANVLEAEEDQSFLEDTENPALFTVFRLVGNVMGLDIKAPPKIEDKKEKDKRIDYLQEIARFSKVRTRPVMLRGNWWKEDCGPLIGQYEETKKPVALLPARAGHYELYDPEEKRKIPVSPSVSEQLAPYATMIYKPFPEKPISGKLLFSFGLSGMKEDLLMILFMGIASGIIGILTPMATGILFDTVIPGAERNQLFQVITGLFIAAFAGALFQITRGVAIVRISGRMGFTLQAAMWDRLLELPIPFFRDYTAGELAERTMGISAIRQVLTGSVTTSILGGLIGAFNILLLFYYSIKLALVALLLVFIGALVTFIVGKKQMVFISEMTAKQQKISGMVLQFISGISKLKTTGTESRAYGKWAAAFSGQKETAYEMGKIQNYLTIFNSGYVHLATLTIFAVFAYWLSNDSTGTVATLSTGNFLAFNAAFGSFMTSGIQMSTGIITLLSVMPHYENARTILETLPEVDETKAHPGELKGDIEVNHVFFRYAEDGPLVLKDVSLRIQPGQFVAVVGGSGSGKSTLLRILLGFEAPESGSVFYDGQDLSGLDIRMVRRQSGVVLQNAQLMAGDIYTNIVGSSSYLTVDDAWEAAEAVGLHDDIKSMPMGMHTVLSEGSGGLSGGQRQRLVIARSIVHKPKILFFDEATSALDNHTQAVVTKSLEKLEATRIVIAHRLSTIKNADIIFVMDKGNLVQSGPYDTLINEDGPFRKLAKRQIA